jgi:hypothetical protein
MKLNKLLNLFVLFVLSVLSVSFSIQGQVYDFPVKTETPEWKKLKNYPERVKVCQTPTAFYQHPALLLHLSVTEWG